jgi:hypothetical protein
MEIYKLSPNPEGEGQGNDNDVTGLGPDTWILFIVRREVSRVHMMLSNFNLKLIKSNKIFWW